MRHIPEKIDIEEVGRACDYLMIYMRNHPVSDEAFIKAVGIICQYVTRTKQNIEWLETLISVIRHAQAEEVECKDG